MNKKLAQTLLQVFISALTALATALGAVGCTN